MGLANLPDTFLQPWLLPPQTPHLSNFFLEFSRPSQPALMQRPWMHSEGVSGEHGVPSTTCGGGGTRWCRQYHQQLVNMSLARISIEQGSRLGSQDVEVAGAVSAAD